MTTYYTVDPVTPGNQRAVQALTSFVDFPITGNTATKTESGYVYDSAGATVSGATVKMFRQSDDAKVGETTSDVSGHYSFIRDAADTNQYWFYAYSEVPGATPTVQIHGTSDRGNVPA